MTGDKRPEPPSKPKFDRPGPDPLAFHPLASSATILTKLRRVHAFSRTSGELDVAKVVEHLSRGRFPRRFASALTRKSWGQSIHLVLDEHEHLNPYREDDALWLRRCDGFSPGWCRDLQAPLSERRDRIAGGTVRSAEYTAPDPGTTVLALSDLGAARSIAPTRVRPGSRGQRFYRERGARPIALVPCDIACIPVALTRDWIVIPWEGQAGMRVAGLNPEQVEQVSRRILTLLAYALRIEPLLIRETRRLLVKGHLGAGVESRVWQDPALRCQEYDAVEFQREAASQLQADFDREAPDLRWEVISLLRRCHLEEYEFVWFLERLGLEAETAKLGNFDDDLESAASWVLSRQRVLEGDAAKPDPMSDESLWFRRAFVRLPESPFRGSAGDSLHQIWKLTGATKDEPPAGLDPARVRSFGRSVATFDLLQVGDRLIASPNGRGPDFPRRRGSLLGTIRTRNALIKIEPLEEFWAGGEAPAWADSWGTDPVGSWVDLRVEGASQRLRWIPPGKFWMGSVDDEAGRYPDEGPRHEETIPAGFWMFDTPCTQALWEAVMGDRPSHFEGRDRPVESVSWDQCQEFLKRLNERCEGLELKLPSEAQWEYACRAGTDTPRYRENLNQIAWYGDNSNHETHLVGQKAPNDWGLYDTLGNVFEWCEDAWTEDYKTRKRAAASARRVIRGGSWNYGARGVRAACRYRTCLLTGSTTWAFAVPSSGLRGR